MSCIIFVVDTRSYAWARTTPLPAGSSSSSSSSSGDSSGDGGSGSEGRDGGSSRGLPLRGLESAKAAMESFCRTLAETRAAAAAGTAAAAAAAALARAELMLVAVESGQGQEVLRVEAEEEDDDGQECEQDQEEEDGEEHVRVRRSWQSAMLPFEAAVKDLAVTGRRSTTVAAATTGLAQNGNAQQQGKRKDHKTQNAQKQAGGFDALRWTARRARRPVEPVLARAVQTAFAIANRFRLLGGFDSPGHGYCPWDSEPATIVLITTQRALEQQTKGGEQPSSSDDTPFHATPSTAGAEFFHDARRWDQRFFALVLPEVFRDDEAAATAGTGAGSSSSRPQREGEGAAGDEPQQTPGTGHSTDEWSSPAMRVLQRQCQSCAGWAVSPRSLSELFDEMRLIAAQLRIGAPSVRICPGNAATATALGMDGELSDAAGAPAATPFTPPAVVPAAPPRPGAGPAGDQGVLVRMVHSSPAAPVHAPQSEADGRPTPHAAWTTPGGVPPPGRGSSKIWPIPECFWVDRKVDVLPPRDAHPSLHVKLVPPTDTSMVLLNLISQLEFPFDTYDLISCGRPAAWAACVEQSGAASESRLGKVKDMTSLNVPSPPPFAERILPGQVLQVYVPGSGREAGTDFPIGVIRRVAKGEGLFRQDAAIELILLPYNYAPLLQLVHKAHEMVRLGTFSAERSPEPPHRWLRVAVNSEWRQQWLDWYRILPPYYRQPVKRALSHYGLHEHVHDRAGSGFSNVVEPKLKRQRDASQRDQQLCLQAKALSSNERIAAATSNALPDDIGDVPVAHLLAIWERMRSRLFGGYGHTVTGLSVPGVAGTGARVTSHTDPQTGRVDHVTPHCVLEVVGASVIGERPIASMGNYVDVLARTEALRDPSTETPPPDEDTRAGVLRQKFAVHFGSPFEASGRAGTPVVAGALAGDGENVSPDALSDQIVDGAADVVTSGEAGEAAAIARMREEASTTASAAVDGSAGADAYSFGLTGTTGIDAVGNKQDDAASKEVAQLFMDTPHPYADESSSDDVYSTNACDDDRLRMPGEFIPAPNTGTATSTTNDHVTGRAAVQQQQQPPQQQQQLRASQAGSANIPALGKPVTTKLRKRKLASVATTLFSVAEVAAVVHRLHGSSAIEAQPVTPSATPIDLTGDPITIDLTHDNEDDGSSVSDEKGAAGAARSVPSDAGGAPSERKRARKRSASSSSSGTSSKTSASADHQQDRARHHSGGGGKMSQPSDALPPLPPGWTVCYSNSRKREYFFNSETGVSAWERPTS